MTPAIILAASAIVAAATIADESNRRRRHINLPQRGHDLPFSDAVVVDETVYLSGRIGLDPATGKLPATVEDEIRFLLDGIKDVLAQAGCSMDDLIFVQVFCPDVSLFDRFNRAYRSYFRADFPARAFLGSGPLLFGARFELQAIAVKP
jgi:reactive intermediate/imine deaminase